MSDLKATIEKEKAEVSAKLSKATEVASELAQSAVDADLKVHELTFELECLEQAIAAISGEKSPIRTVGGVTSEKVNAITEAVDDGLADLSAEDFEKEMSRKRRIAKKEKREAGPYAGIPCKSCGEVGSLFDTVKTMRGKPIKIIACDSCSSVSYQ